MEIGKKPLIELKELKKVYSRKGFSVKALDGINLEIFKGEFLGIIGRFSSCLDSVTRRKKWR